MIKDSVLYLFCRKVIPVTDEMLFGMAFQYTKYFIGFQALALSGTLEGKKGKPKPIYLE
jgi:hypothetical protein